MTALAPGTRLGSYEIGAAIGAGGMGEGFRARDTTLNREVAIKVLPAALAKDAERLARFKREARLQPGPARLGAPGGARGAQVAPLHARRSHPGEGFVTPIPPAVQAAPPRG